MVTRQRTTVLSNLAAGRAVVGALRSCRNDAETICFVVMPDHLHWLLQLGPRLSISQVVSKTKSAVSRNFPVRLRGRSPIWQRGFHDRRLRPSEDLRSVARYVIENPVRAGLVQSIRDYPHWDASWL
ncbi:transposase [Halomonas denitrificans]|nr:transposase [Halomonas denitrificans]